MDGNYFVGKDFTVGSAEPLRSSVPVQWALDLMCEKLQGVSILSALWYEDLYRYNVSPCSRGITGGRTIIDPSSVFSRLKSLENCTDLDHRRLNREYNGQYARYMRFVSTVRKTKKSIKLSGREM